LGFTDLVGPKIRTMDRYVIVEADLQKWSNIKY